MTFVANTGDQAACLTKGERYDLDTEMFIATESAYGYAEKLVDQAHGAFQDGAGLASPPSAADGPTRIAPSAAAPLLADTVRSHPRPGSNSDGNIVMVPALTASNDPSRSPQAQEVTRQYEAVLNATASVRRLTPTECERLQGFPDGWTDLGGTPDSRRYAALGDAVTVPVAEWIGRRIRSSE